MTSNQVFEKYMLSVGEITLKMNDIVTTEYIILAKNQLSVFIFHYLNAKLPLKLQFDSYVTAVKFLTFFIFKTTWFDLVTTLLESV